MIPRIHVVTEPSWICRKLAGYLEDLSGFRVRVSEKIPHNAELTYYLTYLFREFYLPAGKSVALFTHYTPGKHQQRYDKIAQQVEHRIVLSAQHYDYLVSKVGEQGVTRVHIPVCQTWTLPTLKVGWFHRSPTGYQQRKREDLADSLQSLPWITLIKSKGQMSEEQLWSTMKSVDVFLTTSDYESGPVSLLEGLSLGKAVVIPRDVGLANEYQHLPTVHLFERGNFESLRVALESVYRPICEGYKALSCNTVEHWRQDHAKIFEQVLR